MKRNKNISLCSLVLAAAIVITGCQKMNKPELAGDFPRDTNPVGGPLKFFTAFDGIGYDSVRATFGQTVNAAYSTGVSGKGYKGGDKSYIKYASSNDWNKSTSFTIAFWMKSPNPPAGIGAQFFFTQATSTDIWTKADIFLLMEDGGQSNGGKAAMKFYMLDQWMEFVVDGATDWRLPILDDQWHHLAFTYNETASKLTVYRDGVAIEADAKRSNVLKNGAPRGAFDLTKGTGFIIGGPGALATGGTPDSWMVNYRGELDQFRLYGEALNSTAIMDLFSKKQ